MDYGSPGYSVYGMFQARRLEWVAIPFPRRSSQPRSPALQADSLRSESPRKRCGHRREEEEWDEWGSCGGDGGGQTHGKEGTQRVGHIDSLQSER